MNEREIKNSGFDALDREHADVTAMLGALPRVKAPENFEFGVKARIAKGSARRSTFLSFLKVAAPLSLVFAVAGFGIFYGTLPAENGEQVAQAPAKITPAAIATPSETLAPVPATPQSQPIPDVAGPVGDRPERASVSSARPSTVRRPTNSRTSDNVGGGSVDSAVRIAPTILPPGFGAANPGNANVNANAAGARVPITEVFGMVGIRAEFVQGGWKVLSVTDRSVASRAKLLAGDVIEAIDGKQLKGNLMTKGDVTTVTVRRDGKTINLDFK